MQCKGDSTTNAARTKACAWATSVQTRWEPCLGRVQVFQSLACPLVGGLQQLQSLGQVAFGTHDAGLHITQRITAD